jgi:hypothetical protein
MKKHEFINFFCFWISGNSARGAVEIPQSSLQRRSLKQSRENRSAILDCFTLCGSQ